LSKPEDFFNYQNGVLHAGEVGIDSIAQKLGTPLYVYSEDAFLTPLKELSAGLSGLDHLICFAMKSNSNLAILKMLSQNGAGMDIVSGGELFRVMKAGVAPSKVVFSGVGKTVEEMKSALATGIYSFNVESLEELSTLNSIATAMRTPAHVALRFNPDVSAKTHPYISTGLKRNKFGIRGADILNVAKNLSSLPAIRLRGVSIHIGSQLTSLSPLNDAFSKTTELLSQLHEILGQPLEFVDVGGGVGIRYTKESPPSIAHYTKLIRKHFVGAKKPPIKIVLEPGRSISGNAGALITQVLFRKSRGKKEFVIVDAAMTELLRPALYGSHHQIVPLKKGDKKSKSIKADLVGPVCESSDCFASDYPVPSSIASGDFMAILSAGAYGFTMSSNYNSRPRPPEVLVQGKNFRVIRERETFHDLIRGESL
jgi:diaminopimelate decarboxylase